MDRMEVGDSVKTGTTSWAAVVNRRVRGRSNVTPGRSPRVFEDGIDAPVERFIGRSGRGVGRGNRFSRSATVVIRAIDAGKSAGDLLKIAKERFPVEDAIVDSMRVREAAGGLVLEILGKDGAVKADSLAGGLRSALVDTAKVYRPVRMATLKLSGLDPMTGGDEVRSVIASVGGCLESDISVGEIKRFPGGLRAAWVKCPVFIAEELTSRGRLRIGWSTVTTGLYKLQRLQCFKCWNFGHVRETCKVSEDRSKLCFRCGLNGHIIKDCVNAARCVLCDSNGLDSAHRVGSALCKSAAKSTRVFNVN